MHLDLMLLFIVGNMLTVGSRGGQGTVLDSGGHAGR
jgi:hypothetical protein